jgi:pimeloyl-ACP methyl ester carboxylesterase
MTEQIGPAREVSTHRGTLRYFERGDGPPIVFLHGIGVNPLLWRKVVPELAGSFRCVMPELPLGSHELTMSPDADLTPHGLAALVAGFLEGLDLREVTLLGNDTGGAIAQLVATRHPERLGRLVLTPCDAFEHFPPPLFRPLVAMAWVPGLPWLTIQQMRVERLRYLPFAYGKLVKRRMPKEITDAYLGPLFRYANRRDLTRMIRAVRKHHLLEAAEKLRRFDRPVLIAWPPEDPAFPFEHARRLANLLPDATLVEIEDSYGFVSEDQPKALASAIGPFMSGP